ncbi:MAG: sulfur carrier protein ThiS [Deltaproteobacteria bacterium]|nr:sulfur carrier protein ThiS [Deltaproteobacteria bacterium]
MIVVNDAEQPWREGLTILDILRELDPSMPIAVVRLNGSHVPRSEWEARTIRDGDEIRVVHIIAGG